MSLAAISIIVGTDRDTVQLDVSEETNSRSVMLHFLCTFLWFWLQYLVCVCVSVCLLPL